MIHVIALITAQPGQRDQVLAAFNANVPTVLAEAGCIEYGATVDAKDLPPSRNSVGPDTFVVVEKWASLAALQAHAVAPHMKTYGAAVKEMVANRVIHVLEPVAAS